MLEVRGLGCHACARRAEEVLRKLAGVQAATISVLRDRARVHYDGRRTSVRELAAGMGRAGYEVRPAPRVPRERGLTTLGVSVVAFANLLALDRLAGDSAPRSAGYVRLALAAIVLGASGIPLWARSALRGRGASFGRDQLASLAALGAFALGVLELGAWPGALLSRLGLGADALHAAHALGFETAAGIVLATCLVRGAGAALASISRADLGARDRARASSARRLGDDGREQVVPSATLAHGARVRLVEGDRAPIDLELLGSARVAPAGAEGPFASIDLHAGARLEAGAVLLSSEVIGRVVLDRATVAAAMDAEVHRALDRIDADAARPHPFSWSAVAVQTLLVAAMSFAAFAVFLHAFIGGDLGRPAAVLAAIAVIAGSSTAAFSLAAPIARGIAVLRARAAAVVVRDAGALERLAAVDIACFDEVATLSGDAARALWDRGVGCRLLSSEPHEAVAHAAHRLGIPCSTGLSPAGKARAAAELQRGDARVLWISRGGGAAGAADVTVALAPGLPPTAVDAPIAVNGGPERLPALIDLARALRRRLRENAAITTAYNAVVIPAAVAGWISPLQAAGLLLIEAAIVLGNAARLLFPGEGSRPLPPPAKPAGPPIPRSTGDGHDVLPLRA